MITVTSISSQLTERVNSVAHSDAQQTAIDLYERGFNVVPVQRPGKRPFIRGQSLFNARLHHCNGQCHPVGRYDIAPLFHRKNVGLVVGRTSGNLVCVDCDTEKAFKWVGQELQRRGLPFWAFRSSRGGGYLLRLSEGEAVTITKEKSRIPGVEILGNRRVAVVPPSLHKSGVIYQWLSPEPMSLMPQQTLPEVSVKDLEFLGVRLLEEERRQWKEPELFGLPGWAGVLSYANRKLYGSAGSLKVGQRNAALTRVAYDMAGNQIDYSEAELVICDMAEQCRYPKREAVAVLRSAYRKPGVASARPSTGTTKLWQRAAEFYAACDWRGRFGRRAMTLKAIYWACIQRARMDGREPWRASEREVGELANIEYKTARRGMRTLQDAGMIERVYSKKRHAAGRYRFVLPRSVLTPGGTSCSCSGVISDQPKTQAEQDLFKRLGRAAWAVWRYLLTHRAHGAHELSRALNMPYSTTYSALRCLVAAGMVGSAEGFFTSEPIDDQGLARRAAAANDGASPSKARKERHTFERQRYNNRIVDKEIARFHGE